MKPVLFVILSICFESALLASVSPKLDFASESVESEENARKFYGVHVIVDTTKLKRTSDQASEVINLSGNPGKNEKTIGIRTDITFEIPAKKTNDTGNETKSTENESSGTAEDDSVPVFKGRDSEAAPEPRFQGREDRDWKPIFLPNDYKGFWTTERSFLPVHPRHRSFHGRLKPPFVPYMIGQNEKVAVKPLFKPPCRCDSYESDASFGSRSAEEPPFRNIYFVPKEDSVDDKLDGGFKVN